MSKSNERLPVEKRVAAALKAERIKQGLSQTRLAEMADVSRSTVTHLESGIGRPTLWVLTKVSEALGVELWKVVKKAS